MRYALSLLVLLSLLVCSTSALSPPAPTLPRTHATHAPTRACKHPRVRARARALSHNNRTVPTTEKSPPLFYIKNYNWGKDDEEDSWDDDDDWGSDLLV